VLASCSENFPNVALLGVAWIDRVVSIREFNSSVAEKDDDRSGIGVVTVGVGREMVLRENPKPNAANVNGTQCSIS
jgi:hypothetical protein